MQGSLYMYRHAPAANTDGTQYMQGAPDTKSQTSVKKDAEACHMHDTL